MIDCCFQTILDVAKKKKEQSVFGVPDNGVQVEDASSESDSSVSGGKQDSPPWP